MDVLQIDHTLVDVIVVDREQRLPIGRIRTAKYTVDSGARGMREVFRSVSWPPRFWA
jgi:hypothetical protein